jgi:hypothetical protein
MKTDFRSSLFQFQVHSASSHLLKAINISDFLNLTLSLILLADNILCATFSNIVLHTVNYLSRRKLKHCLWLLPNPLQAKMSHSNNSSHKGSPYGKPPAQSRPVCTQPGCGLAGHYSDTCWTAYPHLRPRDNPSSRLRTFLPKGSGLPRDSTRPNEQLSPYAPSNSPMKYQELTSSVNASSSQKKSDKSSTVFCSQLMTSAASAMEVLSPQFGQRLLILCHHSQQTLRIL